MSGKFLYPYLLEFFASRDWLAVERGGFDANLKANARKQAEDKP
jgi:hypothetical protein